VVRRLPLGLALVALLASALLLVRTSYESRRLYTALDQARNEQDDLEAEFKRLDAERRAQSTHLRVERLARERLQMHTANPALTAYVADPGPQRPVEVDGAAAVAAGGAR
jgi:cell division protein FtsL